MARKPVYGLHKARGLARTTVNGKRLYLGEYGSPGSLEKFAAIIDQWEASRKRKNSSTMTRVTVSWLAVRFMNCAESEYVRDGVPTGEAKNFKYALRHLPAHFHGVPTVDFGPKKLKDVQAKLAEEGLSQSSVNGRVHRIKQMFDWAVSEELIEAEIAVALHSVKGIRRARRLTK